MIKRTIGCLLVIALAACGGSASTAQTLQTQPSPQAHSSARAAPPTGAPVHVAVILMENHEYGDIIGSSDAPFINRLSRSSALATGMSAITHPSLPNYLALTGGSTFGISSDCTDCAVGGRSIVDQLESAHVSWRAYMEGLPHSCFTGASANDYAKKHDPFVYYTRVAGNPAWCGNVVPFGRLAADERANALPRFVWITPNLCHDMHDCSVATGDRFLAGVVPTLLNKLGPHGLLVLTWDEGTSDNGCCRLASGGHVVTILAGGLARRGARMGTPVDHYSVLQTIEDLLRLPRLRGAACGCTASLRPLLSG